MQRFLREGTERLTLEGWGGGDPALSRLLGASLGMDSFGRLAAKPPWLAGGLLLFRSLQRWGGQGPGGRAGVSAPHRCAGPNFLLAIRAWSKHVLLTNVLLSCGPERGLALSTGCHFPAEGADLMSWASPSLSLKSEQKYFPYSTCQGIMIIMLISY